MAHNKVSLLGAIIRPPEVGSIDGQYIYATFRLTVVRDPRKAGDNNDRRGDYPLVMTRDPEVIRDIDGLGVYDIVIVKGVIATRPIIKSSHCANCHATNRIPGVAVYVEPISCKKIASLGSKDECQQYLMEFREFSNQISVYGTLCRDPSRRSVGNRLAYTQYQIALNRNFRIKADPPECRADYPWVKAYGQNAEDDAKRLHVGSEVIIDGFLQTRKVLRHSVCGQAYDDNGKPMFYDNGLPVMKVDEDGDLVGCGETYDWPDPTTEIVPYGPHGTDYVLNYYTDEDLREKEKKEQQRAFESAGLNLDDDDSDYF